MYDNTANQHTFTQAPLLANIATPTLPLPADFQQGISTPQDIFLTYISDYMLATHHYDLFEKIVSNRTQEITRSQPADTPKGNLYTTLTGNIAASICGVTSLSGLPDDFAMIEKTAIALYGDILSCWAAFKVHQIIADAQTHLNSHQDSNEDAQTLEVKPESYRYEVVNNIRHDERLFMTSYSDVPMKLSLANVLINLETFVKQQHWYEMLYYLDVSSSGEHFILYQEQHDYPLLLSSALIQRWGQRDNWLTFDPFFQTESWTLSLSSEKINTLERSGIFSNGLKNKLKTSSVSAFDYSLLQATKQESAVCEIIRMAIAGPREKLNHILYLTLKYLTLKLADIGIEAAYTIVEQPSILGFYQSVNNDGDGTLPYVSLCHQKVEGTALTTYQGIVFTGPMSQAFEQCSFRDYNKRIIAMRKQARVMTNA
ncbi:acyl-homoserine-lactone synthase [Enterovibrio sp. ZSDZ42]|uniref:acyl-homoserine-lactone synthase n=1 Tax=Enterovibrio gelatinilyticus TaxID=2899819 RepID=A0ABT5QUV4_9GAMM|nr:acyl-homoserine-lactone synthase [Enterovibrio sp. ZSDZ42]MDD1791795.1 acyl-homoserine-lactone synthase [Enterovibrio sp. ZSDZ42]